MVISTVNGALEPNVRIFQEKEKTIKLGPQIAERAMTGAKFDIFGLNPDQLVQNKGRGLEVYQEMVREPYVKAAMDKKKFGVLKVEWDIIPAGDEDIDKEIADFVKRNFKTIKGTFNTLIYHSLDALNLGYSIGEKVWQIVDGKIILEKVLWQNPEKFDFDTDRFSQVTGITRRGINTNLRDIRSEPQWPIDKFFYINWLGRYENPYGYSDLRAAYRAFFIKDIAWKLRSIFMEKFGSGIFVGKFPADSAKAVEVRDELFKIMKRLMTDSAVVIPDDVTIESHNLAASGETEYQRALEDLNKEILIGITGEFMTTEEGSRTGARALGEVHAGTLASYILFLDHFIAEDVNEQLVMPLVNFNFPNVLDMPKFKWNERQTEDLTEIVGVWDIASTKLGLPIATKDAYEKFNIPVPAEGAELLKAPSTPAPQSPFNNPEDQTGHLPEDQSGHLPDDDEDKIKLAEKKNSVARFVEVDEVNKQLDELLDTAIKLSRKPIRDIKFSILEQTRKLRIFETGNQKDVSKVRVNVGDFKKLSEKSLIAGSMLGNNHATEEAERQIKEFDKELEDDDFDTDKLIKKPEKFEEDWFNFQEPSTASAASKEFAGRVSLTARTFKKLVDTAKDKAFTVSGVLKKDIEQNFQPLITDAIEQGQSFSTFKNRLDDLFETRYLKTTPEVQPGQIQTVFRNSIFSSYNRSRDNVILESDVLQEVFPAFEYAAVLDNRVRPSHEKLDGRVYRANDPIWETINPPSDHNCRCIKISVNVFDFEERGGANKQRVPADFTRFGQAP